MFKTANVCPWTADQCAQILCMSNFEPSRVGILLCKAATVCLCTAYQCAQTLLCVLFGCGKQFEVADSLNHDIIIMTYFQLHMLPKTPISEPNTSVGIIV